MPANLPPQYYELEREYNAETDPREKLRMAQELLRMMPKHKGTDKLQADMKTKISKLRKQIESGGGKSGAHKADPHDHIEREGARQVILIGPPNTGKSSLVDELTGAKPLVADYPFTTREPMPGMMPFETIQIQLIDTPPISPDLFENYLTNLIRNADLVLLVCDLADPEIEKNTQFVVDTLREKRIELVPEVAEEPEDPRLAYKKTVVCGHKEYDDESGDGRKKLALLFPDHVRVHTSILDEDSMAALKKTVFEALKIVRVYTKQVGKKVEYVDPVVLPVGGTVEDAARDIHKDFAEKLKFARIWGEGKHDGQRVNRDHVLEDGDVIEFHI